MKKRIVIAVVVVLVLAALGVGGWWLWVTYGQESDGDGTLAGSGTVEADTIAVSSVIAAPVIEIAVEEGAEVASGTVLFRLDDGLLSLQVEQAEAGVRAAQAALDQAVADAASLAEQDRLKARVDQAEAVRQMAEIQLDHATIQAPSDGTITLIATTVGENATPGRTLATLADLEELHVRIFVAEPDIANVSIGDGARVTTDSSDREFEGEVVFIASEAEFTPSNVETREQRVKLVYEVRLSVRDISGILKPGMSVDVEF